MLIEAMKKFGIHSTETLYIGDEEKDLIAATAAGIDYVIINREVESEFVFTDLLTAKATILAKIFKIG
jgi:phosphoglycolate phosphatase-like HAD superfamily hydrolase